jgi:cytochrome c oxidase assembly protein subunit 15
LIGLVALLPLIYFTIKYGFWVFKKYGIIFLLISLQGFLGWYMVSSGLVNRVDVSHYRLSIHLVTAFIILSIVFWNLLKLTNVKTNQISISLYLIKFFLLLLFIQLIMGAFVSGLNAGTVYNTWPLMGSSYFPDDSDISEFIYITIFDNPSLVQFIHRNLAYLIVIIYIYILILVFRGANKIFHKPIILVGVSLFLQVVLGIITLLSGVKIFYASLHQINSVFMILSTLYLLYLANYKKN